MTQVRPVERAETPVMFLTVQDNSAEIGEGWDHLESMLGSLRSRRFLGVFDDSGSYCCCVQTREGDDARRLGLLPGLIPGGWFLRATVRGAQPAAYAQLVPTFEGLQHAGTWDRSRPCVEYYRREDRIDVLMRVARPSMTRPHRSTVPA